VLADATQVLLKLRQGEHSILILESEKTRRASQLLSRDQFRLELVHFLNFAMRQPCYGQRIYYLSSLVRVSVW
jgi:hypothetical protein